MVATVSFSRVSETAFFKREVRCVEKREGESRQQQGVTASHSDGSQLTVEAYELHKLEDTRTIVSKGDTGEELTSFTDSLEDSEERHQGLPKRRHL